MQLILAQTDTTVGFLSQDELLLARTKGRPQNKPFLKVFSTFEQMTNHVRIPLKHRLWVRHARQTTFVIKNQACRYVGGSQHARLVERYGWLYSTSANESGKSFDQHFCENNSDLIIEDARGLQECSPSKMFKLTSTQYKRLR